MRVNVYAEEMTDRIEIVEKTTKDGTFTGLRFYLELPVTMQDKLSEDGPHTVQVRGPFMHNPGDDDSAAVTFWGKRGLREVLVRAIAELDAYYAKQNMFQDPIPSVEVRWTATPRSSPAPKK